MSKKKEEEEINKYIILTIDVCIILEGKYTIGI
jgi:hypothetical protein